MFPDEKSPAIGRAIEETFGVASIEGTEPITRGLSSDLVYRIVVKGSPYLLRVMTQINERMDPERIFSSMRAASDAGITPHVLYTNTQDGISITDFVETLPLSIDVARLELPKLLARLHALPPFPKTFNWETAHKGFIWRFRSASLLDASEVEEGFRGYDRICASYPRSQTDFVSSHMDLKPENILFDGRRVWLVDWQVAFCNHRYFDLSVVANFVLRDDGDEDEFLNDYFGRPATDRERALFFVMRQTIHMFYASVFLLISAGGKPIDAGTETASFREFHDRIWAGEIQLTDKATQLAYGLIHWRRLLHNLRTPRFEESLRAIEDPGGAKLLPQLV